MIDSRAELAADIELLTDGVPAGIEGRGQHLLVSDPSTPAWLWHPSSEAMPPLPPRQDQSVVETAIESR